MNALKKHQELVNLISEESEELENTKDLDQAKKLSSILEFLVELQIIQAEKISRQ